MDDTGRAGLGESNIRPLLRDGKKFALIPTQQ